MKFSQLTTQERDKLEYDARKLVYQGLEVGWKEHKKMLNLTAQWLYAMRTLSADGFLNDSPKEHTYVWEKHDG